MAIEVCVLASGSSGNCTVLRTPAGVVLVDAGLGPREAGRRLVGTGVHANDVSAVCLTHLDGDHFNPNWLASFARHGVRVFCHGSRAVDLAAVAQQRGCAPQVVSFNNDEPFELLPGLTARAIPLPHDRTGSHAFVFEGFGCRVGYATDLGHVPDHLFDHFCGLDVLAIESNYDAKMQRDSARPWFLKSRITGGAGHLSNDQALAAVRRILARCESAGAKLPVHIVLLHRSRQCNCPRLLRDLFSQDARIAPRLTLAEQHERSEWLCVTPREKPLTGEQMSLFAVA